MNRRLVILIVGPLLALLGAGAAWAFWTATGTGTASASTGTINAPTSVAASTTAGSGTVNVSWTNSTVSSSGSSPSGYYVTRVRNSDSFTDNACGTSPTLVIAGPTCVDLTVPDGIYHYVVTAVMATWTAASSSSDNVTVVNDTTPPTVTIDQAAGQADPTNSSTVVFTVNFSEAVTGFASDDVTITGTATGARSVSLDGAGAGPYTVTVTSVAGTGTVIADIAASRLQDLAGNNNTTSTSLDNTVTVDTVSPTVAGVSSTQANGSYKIGQVIPVTVTFSEPVTVTGTPTLTLSTGSPTTTPVEYATGSGTSALTFNYTVATGNTSADLDYAAVTSLALGTGTIRDALENNATLTLAVPGAANSLSFNKAIVIDTTAPTVTSVSSPATNGSYKAGSVISVTVTFSESVTVTGTPQLTLSTGSPATTAVNYASGSGTSVLAFDYTVGASNSSADLDYALTTSLALNGGTIRDAATNDGILTLASPGTGNSLGANKALVIDTSAPSVLAVSSSLADGTYKTGQLIPVTVTFSEPVAVTGAPQLILSTGSPATTAVNYSSGTGTNILGFNYTVSASNFSADLDYALTTSLVLNGGTIRDAGTNDATLTLAAPAAATSLGANKALVIDAVAPTPFSITTTAGANAGKPEVNDTVSFTYSELMSPSSLYDGWTNATQSDVTNATVTFNDATTGNGTNSNTDTFAVTVSGHALTIGGGSNMEAHIVSANGGSYSFTAKLQYSVVASKSVVTVTLTALNSGGATVSTATGGTATWSPGTGATDAAGNGLGAGTPVTAGRPF